MVGARHVLLGSPRRLRKKRLIEDGNSVKPDGVKYVMGKLKKKLLTEDLIKAHLTKHEGYIDKSVTYENWNEYFNKKYKETMAFWKEADKLGSSVTFSV